MDVGNAMLGDEEEHMGNLLENYVASSFLNLDNTNHIPYKTYYDDCKENVDFIVQRGRDKPIPIEVNWNKKNKSHIKRAMRKYQSPHGVIISNTISNVVKKENIVYLPHEIFAFM